MSDNVWNGELHEKNVKSYFSSYWNCIKNEYMIVKYENGYEETISEALKKGTININDLDSYNIEYIKEKK